MNSPINTHLSIVAPCTRQLVEGRPSLVAIGLGVLLRVSLLSSSLVLSVSAAAQPAAETPEPPPNNDGASPAVTNQAAPETANPARPAAAAPAQPSATTAPSTAGSDRSQSASPPPSTQANVGSTVPTAPLRDTTVASSEAVTAIPGRARQAANQQAAPTVTESWVIQQLIANNPELHGARLDQEKAQQQIAFQEGRYPYVFEADAGYTHSRSPALAGSDQVTVSTRDSIVVGSQLSRTFPLGTQATLRVEGQRFRSTRPSTTSSVTNQPGVGYQATARASVTQPLLRGAGTDVNEADLRAARISSAVATKAYQSQLSGLLHDGLTAYWELWYTSRATEIEEAALELARAQLEEAKQRNALGALASADVLQFQIRVAQLEESVVSARFNETQQTLSLSQIVGNTSPSAQSWHAADPEPPSIPPFREAELLTRVLIQSPDVLQLEESLKLARERARTAGDEYRSRLDLQGWVEAAGLGAGRSWPAVEQVAGLEAVSAYGGIVYETPLDSKRRDATRAQAHLDVRIAEQNLVVLRQRLQTQVVQLLAQLEQARVSLEAAETTVAISEQQVSLERKRFALGGSTVLQVQEAEDSLRQARLRVARARVNQVDATLTLQHVTGKLLVNYAAR